MLDGAKMLHNLTSTRFNLLISLPEGRPLRDFVARAPTSRSACGGALQNEKEKTAFK